MAIFGPNTGAFLGGVAQQAAVDRKLGLFEQELAQEQDKAQRQQIQDLLKQAKTNLTDITAMAEFAVTQAINSGADRTKINAILDQFAGTINQTAQGLSPLPGGATIAQNARTKLDTLRQMPTLAEQATAEGQAAGQQAVTEAGATADALGLEGEGRQRFIFGQLVPQQSRGEFLTLLSTLKETEPGSQEFEFIRGRLNRLSRPEETGFSIEVTPDGGVRVSQGGAQAGGAQGGVPERFTLTGGKLDELRASHASLEFGVNVTDALLREIEADPTKFGAVGTARRVGETAASIAEDVANTGLSVLGVSAEDLAQSFQGIIAFEQAQGTSPEIIAQLTPTTTRATDVFSKALRYSVARAMQPEGRLLVSTAEAAADMVDITGLKGTDQVRDQLQAIRSLLTSQATTIQRRMEQGVTGEATTPREAPTLPAQETGSGMTGESVKAMSLDEVRQFVEQSSEEDLAALPEDVRNAIAERLKAGQ